VSKSDRPGSFALVGLDALELEKLMGRVASSKSGRDAMVDELAIVGATFPGAVQFTSLSVRAEAAELRYADFVAQIPLTPVFGSCPIRVDPRYEVSVVQLRGRMTKLIKQVTIDSDVGSCHGEHLGGVKTDDL